MRITAKSVNFTLMACLLFHIRSIILLAIIFISFSSFAQSRKDWTQLDFLNKDHSYPFAPEADISGVCFIIVAERFDYYKKPIVIPAKDGKVSISIRVSDTGVTTQFNGQTYDPADSTNPFKPWLFGANPDYFRLALECVDSAGAYYKVKVNQSEFAFINKTNSDFQKQSIIDFVKGWTALGFDFDRSTNPLREAPKDESKSISHVDEKKYKIWTGESLAVKGDWIKVNTLNDEVGWVRWRKGNKVLIRMYFAC